ncbi:MAG: serine dehydratase subunit alpha family protein [Christensenellaceae bacterium]|nr:serine dehydratase subunit alpha family protein [Christensenellaceae bacterium]
MSSNTLCAGVTMPDKQYQSYIDVLKSELVPASGCTEPIAIAFAAAKARSILGKLPDRVHIVVSGNIIKNVKSVIVPNTGGMRGIAAAAAAGIAAGDEERILEVIASVDDAGRQRIKDFLDTCPITVRPSDGDLVFDIDLTEFSGNDSVRIRISEYHTNIVLIEKNGEVIYAPEHVTFEKTESVVTNKDVMTITDIIDFANTVDLNDIGDTIRRQIAYNSAISKEGLTNSYGANVGKIILNAYGNDVKFRAMAAPAAGSDARMSGCELPVIIVSGSGNQGMTASLPVIEYAREHNKTEEELIRAVIVSDLITIHQKSWIGRLSAFCGAVSAGCGAAAGIAYLMGGDYDTISHTLINALAIASGIVCDGAKASCAGKIAAAVNAGLLGYNMCLNGSQFSAGDGFVCQCVEKTIENVGRIGRDGMRETDKEILRIMTED